MAVFRVERNANYTTMSNYHLRDRRLSLKAKGLLSVFLSLPDEWHYSINGLLKITKEGRDSVIAAVRELEKTGYLTRHQERLENGKIGRIEYSIFERPQIPAEDDGGAIQYGDGATDRDIARPEACEEMEGTEDEPDAGFDLVPEEQSAVNGAGAETPVESKHAESLNECRTPEDKPLTDKPLTGKPFTEKPFTGKPFTGKPLTEKPFTEKPFTEKPFTEKPFAEKPLMGKPSTENPTEININKSNTDGSNTKGIKDGGIKGGQQFRRYGTFGNVFLTDDEFDRLRH
ncbi:MAG: hypothetical protein IKD62_05165, partial [Oscillospiraceae bacterium]|nr:hypothetical protein [Oscillospiraceae bacterium]